MIHFGEESLGNTKTQIKYRASLIFFEFFFDNIVFLKIFKYKYLVYNNTKNECNCYN